MGREEARADSAQMATVSGRKIQLRRATVSEVLLTGCLLGSMPPQQRVPLLPPGGAT